jgi:hypothetical protein
VAETAAVDPQAPEDALAEPTRNVSWVFLLSITLANLGIMMVLITPLNNLLPRYAQAITGGDGKEAALAVVSGVGAIAAMVFNPRWRELCPTGPQEVVGDALGHRRRPDGCRADGGHVLSEQHSGADDPVVPGAAAPTWRSLPSPPHPGSGAGASAGSLSRGWSDSRPWWASSAGSRWSRSV